MASLPPEEPSQVISFPGNIALTTTAPFPTFSTTRSLELIINDTLIDNQGSSSSLQSSDSATLTTSDASSSTSTSTAIRQLPPAGPMIAGILVCIILVATIVAICFLKGRPKRFRKRRHYFESHLPDSHLHQHSSSQFFCDEIPSKDPPKQKSRRLSRLSNRTVKLGIRNTVPQISLSTTHSTLNTKKTGVHKSNHQTVDGRLTSVSTLIPSDLGTATSSDQVEHSPRPPSGIELAPQLPSSSSQNKPLQHLNNHASLPEVDRQRLNTLIQQRAALLASENTSNKSVYNKLLLLEEQIQILKRQDVFPPDKDIPPPYEDHR